jgi:2-C-methyl-D-erythritol 2,4-cyclodiphosphate synthase
MLRVGLGQDSHKFDTNKNKPLVLGGVEIAKTGGLQGNSDADVILHSICNALSSAVGGDSLSFWADEMCLKEGIKDSTYYLDYIYKKIKNLNYSIVNLSIAIEAKKPYLEKEIINKIKNKIASLLGIETEQIGLTFTSGEDLTVFGLGKGIQVLTIVNIIKND